jgi:MHS family proline/betaine transporter-like MFS transporter
MCHFFKKNSNRTFLLTSIAGNVAEWYDFGLYSYFLTLIGKLFFPPSNNVYSSTLMALLIFCTGFLARPVGSIFFGHLGDKIGRKKTLLFSIVLISLSASIGLLPTYAEIGIASPFLLLILRILQGVAVSGEGAGVSVFMIESTLGEKKITASCMAMSSVYIGLFLGALISCLVYKFEVDKLLAWAWRLPFLLSLAIGAIVFTLRYNCEESPEFSEFISRNKTVDYPVKYLFKCFPKEMLLTICSSSLIAVVSYQISTFFPNYISAKNHLGLSSSLIIAILPLLSIFLSLLFVNRIVRNFGLYPTAIGSSLGIFALSFPIFSYATDNIFFYNIISIMFLGIILAPASGLIFKILYDLYPVEVRYSGLSLGYNVSMTLFGGTAPLITMILQKSGDFLFPAAYLMIIALTTALSFSIIASRNHHNEQLIIMNET